jgi:hypothetical protein
LIKGNAQVYGRAITKEWLSIINDKLILPITSTMESQLEIRPYKVDADDSETGIPNFNVLNDSNQVFNFD